MIQCSVSKPQDKYDYVKVDGGILVQDTNRILIDELNTVTKKKPTEQEKQDMLLGIKVVKHVKSNAIVVVKDGMAKLEDGTIAGSILTYIQAFKNVMEFTGATVEEAVKMTSGNQAKEFGLESKGAIAVGKDADMVVLNDAFDLVQTISYGKLA